MGRDFEKGWKLFLRQREVKYGGLLGRPPTWVTWSDVIQVRFVSRPLKTDVINDTFWKSGKSKWRSSSLKFGYVGSGFELGHLSTYHIALTSHIMFLDLSFITWEEKVAVANCFYLTGWGENEKFYLKCFVWYISVNQGLVKKTATISSGYNRANLRRERH